MQITGKIIEILDDSCVKVEITRTSACGSSCHSCNGCGTKNSTIIALNKQNLKINEVVCLEMSNNRFFLLSFMIFILPIMSIIVIYQILTFFSITDELNAFLSFTAGIIIFLSFILYSKKSKKFNIPECRKESLNGAGEEFNG